jgi:hypothetical protein
LHIFTIVALISSFCITDVVANDQQELRCTLGGSTIAGMVVHIDPATGRPTSRPLPEQAAEIASMRAMRANRSTQGLVEEVGPTGGLRVNLHNRFRSPLVAVAKAGGGVHADHVSCVNVPATTDTVKSLERQ